MTKKYKPKEVYFTPEQIQALHDEGLQFSKEIQKQSEKMSHPMGYAMQSDIQKVRELLDEYQEDLEDLRQSVMEIKEYLAQRDD